MVKSDKELMQLNGYRRSGWSYATICKVEHAVVYRAGEAAEADLFGPRSYFSPRLYQPSNQKRINIVNPLFWHFSAFYS